MERMRTIGKVSGAVSAGILAYELLGAPVAAQATDQTETINLYNPQDFRYQNPDLQACVFAGEMEILNEEERVTNDPNFTWKHDTSFSTMESWRHRIQKQDEYKSRSIPGTGPMGATELLEEAGYENSTGDNWKTRAFDTFDAAIQAISDSFDKYPMEIGMFGWAGQHYQVITGIIRDVKHRVTGVFLSDPLKSDHAPNKFVSIKNFRSGAFRFRLSRFHDIYSAAIFQGKYVLEMFTGKGFGPKPTPSPTPIPTENPTPKPSVTPKPTPSETPVITPAPSESPMPSPSLVGIEQVVFAV